MKIAILTITDGQNYGNRLQNYALQQALTRLGQNAETIRIATVRDNSRLKQMEIIGKQCAKKILGHKHTVFAQLHRKKKFEIFNRYVKWSHFSIRNNKPPARLVNEYDYFICGSDQVWNPRIGVVRENIESHLASFAPGEKRFSYAASFGTDDLLSEYKTLFSKELSQFRSLSVREDSGKRIVQDCCGRKDTQLVLDPTMLLKAEDWKRIEKKPDYISSQRFVVTYFLGGRKEPIQKYIESICKQYHAIPINLDIEFLYDDQIEDKRIFSTSPDEFIWLVDHAECILTDSFHAAVFAILFHKPFAVFQRREVEEGNEMGSRIDTLLNRFGLIRFRGDLDVPDVIPGDYDFDCIETVLSKERERSFCYMRRSLGIQE